jgi:hypothetical protein
MAVLMRIDIHFLQGPSAPLELQSTYSSILAYSQTNGQLHKGRSNTIEDRLLTHFGTRISPPFSALASIEIVPMRAELRTIYSDLSRGTEWRCWRFTFAKGGCGARLKKPRY